MIIFIFLTFSVQYSVRCMFTFTNQLNHRERELDITLQNYQADKIEKLKQDLNLKVTADGFSFETTTSIKLKGKLDKLEQMINNCISNDNYNALQAINEDLKICEKLIGLYDYKKEFLLATKKLNLMLNVFKQNDISFVVKTEQPLPEQYSSVTKELWMMGMFLNMIKHHDENNMILKIRDNLGQCSSIDTWNQVDSIAGLSLSKDNSAKQCSLKRSKFFDKSFQFFKRLSGKHYEVKELIDWYTGRYEEFIYSVKKDAVTLKVRNGISSLEIAFNAVDNDYKKVFSKNNNLCLYDGFMQNDTETTNALLSGYLSMLQLDYSVTGMGFYSSSSSEQKLHDYGYEVIHNFSADELVCLLKNKENIVNVLNNPLWLALVQITGLIIENGHRFAASNLNKIVYIKKNEDKIPSTQQEIFEMLLTVSNDYCDYESIVKNKSVKNVNDVLQECKVIEDSLLKSGYFQDCVCGTTFCAHDTRIWQYVVNSVFSAGPLISDFGLNGFTGEVHLKDASSLYINQFVVKNIDSYKAALESYAHAFRCIQSMEDDINCSLTVLYDDLFSGYVSWSQLMGVSLEKYLNDQENKEFKNALHFRDKEAIASYSYIIADRIRDLANIFKITLPNEQPIDLLSMEQELFGSLDVMALDNKFPSEFFGWIKKYNLKNVFAMNSGQFFLQRVQSLRQKLVAYLKPVDISKLQLTLSEIQLILDEIEAGLSKNETFENAVKRLQSAEVQFNLCCKIESDLSHIQSNGIFLSEKFLTGMAVLFAKLKGSVDDNEIDQIIQLIDDYKKMNHSYYINQPVYFKKDQKYINLRKELIDRYTELMLQSQNSVIL